MARSSVRSTIATPITPSNCSAISSTRASSFFQNKSLVPFAGEDFCSAKTLPNSAAVTATIVALIRVIRSRDFRALRLTFLEREPRGIEMGEGSFQLFQLRRRAMNFEPGEIGHGEQFGEQCADIVEMREHAFCIFVGFATKKFIAVPAEFVEEHSLLRRGLRHESRQYRLNRIQFPRMHFKIGMNTDEV